MSTGATDGYRLRDEGSREALRSELRSWVRCAIAYTDKLIELERRFTADDLTAVCGLPYHRNAVGAFIGTLARNGIIERVAWTTNRERDVSHATAVAIWRPVSGSGYQSALRCIQRVANHVNQ